MGFRDMVTKAVTQAKREGDFILANQRGTMLIREFKCFKGQSGKFCVLLGDLKEVKPKVQGGQTQPVGSLLKIFVSLYGEPKKQAAGYSNVKNMVQAIADVQDDDEVGEALSVIFGDDEDGISDNASDEAKANPGFAARGVLIDFDSYEVEKDGKKFARVKLHHRTQGNSDQEIIERQKSL